MKIKSAVAGGFFLFLNMFLVGGFSVGTVVKSGNRYVPIEQLNVGDVVTCYDFFHGFTEKPIVCKVLHAAVSCVSIVVNQQKIITSCDQKFYIFGHNVWKKANQLKTGDIFLGVLGQEVIVEEVVDCAYSIDLVDITVKDFHNFLITHENILVHNFIPIVFGLSWSFGFGAIKFAAASIGAGFLGGLLGLKLQKNKHTNNFVVGTTVAFPGAPFPDDPDKNKENPYGRYEDAPYHHENSAGAKSPSPIDGQAALNNSVRIKETSPHRVGVSNNQIVILNQTLQGLYHGHVRSWEEIVRSPSMISIKNALIESGLVDKFGRIL